MTHPTRHLSPTRRSWGLPLVVLALGCGEPAHPDHERWPAPQTPPPARTHDSRLHLPYDHLGMNTPLRDISRRPVRVRCATCHHLLNAENDRSASRAPRAFHTGVKVVHGEAMTCRTCHQPPLFESYRLSSGETVPYAEVMALCGQCHSGQRRDYAHGLHGGMTGYWDLDRGPRDRNHCLDCHNPHQPRIPQVMPAPRPRYRFLGERS